MTEEILEEIKRLKERVEELERKVAKCEITEQASETPAEQTTETSQEQPAEQTSEQSEEQTSESSENKEVV